MGSMSGLGFQRGHSCAARLDWKGRGGIDEMGMGVVVVWLSIELGE